MKECPEQLNLYEKERPTISRAVIECLEREGFKDKEILSMGFFTAVMVEHKGGDMEEKDFNGLVLQIARQLDSLGRNYDKKIIKQIKQDSTSNREEGLSKEKPLRQWGSIENSLPKGDKENE